MAEASRSVAVVLKADVNDYITKMGAASKATKDFASQAGKTAGSAAKATKDLGDSAAKASQGTSVFSARSKQAKDDLDKLTKSTKGFGDQAQDSIGKTNTQAKNFAQTLTDVKKKNSEGFATLSTGMAVAGAAIAAGIGLAVKAFADFDQQMSNVRAVSNATAADMQKLTDAALKAGADTKYSASQAAEAEAELAKAGLSTKDILGGGLNGALSLAAAGNLDLANAATVSANAMNIFSLKGADVGHIADVLASGANKSAADVDQLGQALQQSGLVAAQMGLSLEDTTGILAAFADNGLKGSDAGTSLKTMLQRLVPTSVAAASAMEDIGFSAYDASGNLKSIDVIAGDLQKGLAGLTQKQKDATLATIFGSDAVRGANVLFKLGTKGVQDYTTAVNDQGAAARVAAVQMDNLAGDMENLRGSIETALIKGGSGANDSLRGLAKGATDAVNAFASLPAGVQTAVVQVAALSAGVLLLGGGLATVIPKVIATKAAIDALATSSPRAAAAMGALGKAAGIVGVALAATEINDLAAASRVAQPPVDGLAKGLAEIGDGAQASADFGALFARGMGPFARSFEDANDALADFGSNAKLALDHNAFEGFFQNAGTASATFDTRIKQIDAGLTQLVQGGKAKEAAEAVAKLEGAAQGSGLAAGRITEQLTGYKAALDGAAVAGGQFADSTQAFSAAASDATGSGKLLGSEIEDQQKSADNAAKAYKNLTDAVKGYGSEVSNALSASSAYEQSVDDAAERTQKRVEIQSQISKLQKADAKGNADEIARLKDQLTDYATTLDLGTKAGRDNVASLQAIAQNAKEAAVANFENGASFGEVTGQMDKARGAFVQQAIAFGATKDQAESLATQLGLTSQNLESLRTAADVKKSVTADTSQADASLHSITRQLEAIDGQTARATVQVAYERVGPSLEAIAGLADGTLGPKGFAAGGYTGNVPTNEVAGVTHGKEYVFDAGATSRLGVPFLESLRRGGYPGYRDGGYVTPKFADRAMVSSAMTTNVNSGGNVTNDRRVNIENMNTADYRSFMREMETQQRLQALGTRRAR